MQDVCTMKFHIMACSVPFMTQYAPRSITLLYVLVYTTPSILSPCLSHVVLFSYLAHYQYTLIGKTIYERIGGVCGGIINNTSSDDFHYNLHPDCAYNCCCLLQYLQGALQPLQFHLQLQMRLTSNMIFLTYR